MTHEKGPAVSNGANLEHEEPRFDSIPEALETAIARNWKVFPLHSIRLGKCDCRDGADCKNAGKHPRTRNGVKNSSGDRTTISGWHKQWPDSNWGLATGSASSVFVIDVDAKHGGYDSVEALDLPPTLQVLTGGGGRHYYYVMPSDGERIGNRVGWLPGVDVRGEGGYVVMPGSVHASGARYVWGDPNAELADAPESIVESIRTRSTSDAATDVLSDTAAILEGIPEGQRDHTLFKWACRLRRQHENDADGGRAAVTLLVLHAAAASGFPEREARAKIEQAFKQDHADLELDLAGLIGDEKRPRLVGGGSFILDEPELVPSVWGDGELVLWAEGEGLMIAGQQGLGKTTIAQQLVLSRIGVREPQLLGYSVAPTKGRVLYLAMDRPRQAARSFRRMISDEDRHLLDERLSIWRGPLDVDPLEKGALLKFVRAVAPDADTVIIDSAKDMAAGLSDDKVGAGLNMAWQSLIAEGMELLILHHERKAGGDSKRTSQLDDIYGSTWLTSGLGSVMSLSGTPGDSEVTLHHRKQPVEDLGSLKIYHDHSTGTTEFFRDTDKTSKVSLTDFIVDEEIAVKELMAKLGIDEKREKTIKRQLDALASPPTIGGEQHLEKIPGNPNRYVLKIG